MTDTSKPLTPEQLAEWKRLADAATPWPWTAHKPAGDSSVLVSFGDLCLTVARFQQGAIANAVDNAAFAIAARTAVPLLIAEVERLTAELSEDKALMLETANETERVLAQLRAREVRKALGGKQMNEIPQWALMAANAAIGSRPEAIPPRYWLDVRDAFAHALAAEREAATMAERERISVFAMKHEIDPTDNAQSREWHRGYYAARKRFAAIRAGE